MEDQWSHVRVIMDFFDLTDSHWPVGPAIDTRVSMVVRTYCVIILSLLAQWQPCYNRD